MKGILGKKEGKWVVEYTLSSLKWIEMDLSNNNSEIRDLSKSIPYETKQYPLHPDDVEKLMENSWIFDNFEARVANYPDIEFEIVGDYAKLNRK